jgi:adhesin/invasin
VAAGVPTPTVGTCTITATEADQGTSGTAPVNQVLAGYSASASASPTSIPANGGSNSSIITTVLQNGQPASGIPVTYSLAAYGGASCGTIPAGPYITNASGMTTPATYTSTATSGFCVITPNLGAPASGTGTPALVDQTNTVTTATNVAVNANPTTLPANGASTSIVTATVTGAGNSPVPGDTVHFTLSGATCANSTLLPAYVSPTNASGQVTATFTAGNIPGICTVNAVEAYSGVTGSAPITLLPTKYTVTVAANPAMITANGITTSQVTATVTNLTGGVAGSDLVTFTRTTPAGGSCGTFAGGTVVATNPGSGQATITYTSATNPGFCIVQAQEGTTGGIGTTVIDNSSI